MADEVPEPVEIISHGPEDTQRVGRILGACARPGDLVLLVGDLGAGKTCLTQGILQGLDGSERARSPTYVLVAEYRGRIPLYHVDLFRLGSVDEILDLGLDEYLSGDGMTVVEWAERAPPLFEIDHLKMEIERVDETTRRLRLTAGHPRYGEMIAAVTAERAGG